MFYSHFLLILILCNGEILIGSALYAVICHIIMLLLYIAVFRDDSAGLMLIAVKIITKLPCLVTLPLQFMFRLCFKAPCLQFSSSACYSQYYFQALFLLEICVCFCSMLCSARGCCL